MSNIVQRKIDHLELCSRQDVGFRQVTSLFECVTLYHNALPEMDFGAIDIGCQIFGKQLRAPILIAAMTGGNDDAGRINRELAMIAEKRGYAFGLGSQRPLLHDPSSLPSYQVRDVAPTALVLGNIGVVQACRTDLGDLEALVDSVGADALCVHLNPAMELVQADGDRDFRGNLERLGELSAALPIPVVAKETGCGISVEVAKRLLDHGVHHLDVSGAGGTSWVGVEYYRASAALRPLAETFWDWGIPTAASVVMCWAAGMQTIFATGGIRSGVDVAKAIALGASAAGIARPILRALESEGRAGVAALMDRIETELRMAMLLVGAPDLASLRAAKKMVTEPLRSWLEQDHLLEDDTA